MADETIQEVETSALNAGVTQVGVTEELDPSHIPYQLQHALAHEIWEATGSIPDSPYTENNWLIAGAILRTYVLARK
jgi:hypothetical protein